MSSFDAIIIGAGEAGALFASRAVAAGSRVALIYREPYGSTCVNVGCVPSKYLLARARVAHVARTAALFGIEAGAPTVDLSRIVAGKQELVEGHRAEGLTNARAARGVTLIEGAASFVSPDEIEVAGQRLSAPRILIATGMRPSVPPIRGLDDVAFHTNETIMDLSEAPEHLIVVGGGYIGAELAQAYRRFGSAVTLIGGNEHLVPGEEPEASTVLAEAFAAEGIDLVLGHNVDAVRSADDGVEVQAGDRTVTGSHLLLATGRRANTDDLRLDAAGVEMRDDGSIVVDGRMRTNVPGIWAAGDVNGQQPFTRVCQEEAKVAFAGAFGHEPPDLDRLPLGHAIFTDPEIASVGFTEASARAAGLDVVAGAVDLGQVEKAELIGETRGVLKIVAERGTARLLGLHVAAPHAGDLVWPASVVLRRAGTLDELADATGIFPTLAEGVEGTARAVLRKLGDARPASAGGFACPACGADFELADAQPDEGSLACPSCANQLTLRPSQQQERIAEPAGAARGHLGCPACAAEYEAR